MQHQTIHRQVKIQQKTTNNNTNPELSVFSRLILARPPAHKINLVIMKKIMFIAALATFALTANAQSKEELKAQKEAQKAAEKVVKKAATDLEQSLANPNFGRKETNFDKLSTVRASIAEALKNPLCQTQEAYKVAADVALEYYKKYDAQVKAGDDSANQDLLAASVELLNYSTKYDELYFNNPKKKDVEYKAAHLTYQNYAVNAAIQCLQASQSLSTSDSQDDLKKGAELSSTFLNAMESSHLLSDFENKDKSEWLTIAKAFNAQSLLGIEGTPASQIEAAYAKLKGTKYESVAYSALCNYFRDKDSNKYVEYLKQGMTGASEEYAPNFAFMLMQHQFQNENLKDDCLKTIQMIKEKFPKNENTLNAYLMEGQIYFERKEYSKAEALFAEAVANYPDDDRAITMPAKSAWMKAQSSGDKKDLQHAIDLFKQLESKYPSQPDYWGEPLYILYNNINNNAARDKYKKYYNVK